MNLKNFIKIRRKKNDRENNKFHKQKNSQKLRRIFSEDSVSIINDTSNTYYWNIGLVCRRITRKNGVEKMNKAVSISEMISEIKKQMKWSDAILALEIGVEPKNLNAWRKGTTPRLPNYKKLKGIYDSIKDKKGIPDNTTEKLQQLEKEIEYLTIEKNKAVRHITNINKLIYNLKKEREKLIS